MTVIAFAGVAFALFSMLPLLLLENALALSMLGPLKLSPPQLKSAGSPPLTGVVAGQQVVIATTVANSYGDEALWLIAIIEVRDSDGVTEYLAWQSGELNVGGQMEVGASWVPDRAGSYELRTFAVTDDWENPQVLSAVIKSEVTIGHESSSNHSLSVGNAIFDVPYSFSGDIRILNMTVIAEYITITATVDVGEDGTLEIRLPNEMLKELEVASGFHYCAGNEFAVFIDGKLVAFNSDRIGEDEILTFEVDEGSETIEIIGSDLLMSPTRCPV